ncbi:MAG: metal-dependent hydrolase [Candidatus Sabulitectum sp.]|nr:metal-dependent hydrolase [Candidatus Sabulitectum sp.]
MSSRKTHISVGIASGASLSLAKQISLKEFSHLELLCSVFGGFLGGVLPDVIDPPTSPNHRALGHSPIIPILLAGAALYIRLRLQNNQDTRMRAANHSNVVGYDCWEETVNSPYLNKAITGFFTGLCSGHASHLALDSKTPAGINW